MRIEPEVSGVAIVIVGDFSPSIFTPAWFELQELLPPGASEDITNVVASPGRTEWATDWLTLRVDNRRFTAESLQAPHVRVLDVVCTVFQHFGQIPVRACGINLQAHFKFRSLQERDRVGRLLAPVDPWGSWAEELGPTGREGGMTSLTMTQTRVGGRTEGDRIGVTVEPSTRVGVESGSGVFVRVNDHYMASDENRQAVALIDTLRENFEESLSRAEALVDHIMSLRD